MMDFAVKRDAKGVPLNGILGIDLGQSLTANMVYSFALTQGTETSVVIPTGSNRVLFSGQHNDSIQISPVTNPTLPLDPITLSPLNTFVVTEKNFVLGLNEWPSSEVYINALATVFMSIVFFT